MRMLQLQLTVRLWQQSCHQLDVFCWQGLLGRAASREVLDLLSSSARGQQVPGGSRNLHMVRRRGWQHGMHTVLQQCSYRTCSAAAWRSRGLGIRGHGDAAGVIGGDCRLFPQRSYCAPQPQHYTRGRRLEQTLCRQNSSMVASVVSGFSLCCCTAVAQR